MWFCLTKSDKTVKNMLMSVLYILSVLMTLSCNCLGKSGLPPSDSFAFSPVPETAFPQGGLKEVVIRGWYAPEDPKEAEELKETLLQRGLCEIKTFSAERCGLQERENLEKKHSRAGKERFSYTEINYCYNRTDDKYPVLNNNLRARLYDKKGKMLTESSLIFDGNDIDDSSRSVVSRLPYHNEGHEIRIVRLEREKERFIKGFMFLPYFELLETTFPDNHFNRMERVYIFDEKSQCHISPGPR